MANSEGPQSYYASSESNQKAVRPGQPPGRTVSQLQTNPTREWVKRNSPAQKFDSEKDNFFFSGTSVIKSVGKDEGLSGVRCMAVVNEKVWIGEREGCFSVWDFHTGDRLFRSTKKKDIFVWSVLGPVNGNLVWVGTSDSFVRVFNSDTMELVKEMKEHVGGVYAMADTPGSRLVFTGSADFTIVKWDGPRMERVAQFNGHKNNVRALLVVGKRLFSGSDDNSIKVWDVKSGALLNSFEHHTGGVHALAFACGKNLWSASEDKTIRVWNTDDEHNPCVKVIDSPHTGQINTLTLIGSLMWSSSWNICFVWDPETFEQKGQYKCHEGCINALLPVHQAVVSRVWSASNDGIINLWDTECTYRNAVNAASDGRLEEALVQLEDAQKSVEDAKKKTLEMEQICVQLNGEKDRLNFTHNSAKEKNDQLTRELRRQCQEANQKIFDLKDKLEQAGSHADSDFDIPEVLAAYQKGLEPGSVMPAEYMDSDDLEPAEKERRAKLREAFLKGKANAPLSGDDRPIVDATEARLKAALEKAYRNGDTAGAERVRGFLDDRFPKWRETAAQPIVPIDYLDDAKFSDNERDSKRRTRGQFVEGLVNGNIENVPKQPEGASDYEMEQYRAQRDAFLRGKDAERIFPGDVHTTDRRVAFARGLGNKYAAVPEEYVDSDSLDIDTRKNRAFQRSSFLRGRYATGQIPEEFNDEAGLPTEERERRRKLREHFLYGLTLGPNVELPTEYQDSVSDLEAMAQIRREAARNAFKQGQKSPSIIPDEYLESYSPDAPNVQSLRSELRDAFLQGLGQGEMPNALSGHSEGFNRQLVDAYKRGWIAGCPFDVNVSDKEDGDSVRRPSMTDDLDKRREMMELLERLEKENNALKAENERVMSEHKQTLDDLNKLREQIASFGVERSVRLDPDTLNQNELDMIQNFISDDANPEILGAPHTVKVTGLGEVNIDDLSPENKDKVLSVIAKHRNESDRENFRKEHGLISIGGEIVPELPALDELKEKEQEKVMGINDRYKFQGGPEGAVNLPDWEDMDEDEVAFLRELMSKHRMLNSSPAKSDHIPTANANQILSDAVAGIMDEDMPDDVRKELANVLANNTEQSTDTIRAAVNDSSLPEEIKSKLIDACDQVDEANANNLEKAVRKASVSDSIPSDVRKKFEEALDSKDDDSTNGYVDRLQNAIRRASTVGNVAEDVKKDLREATGENDRNVAALYEQVQNVIHDAALSREQRLALNERIASPSRPHHVPEAVRELLASEHAFPDDVREEFQLALDGHDNRGNELAQTVMDEQFEELADAVDGPRNALPTAVRVKSMNADTPAGDRKVLLTAYNVHQGRTAATEDAARGTLDNLTLPADSRRHLRSAIYRSGVSQEDLLADAVRYAIAHDGTPGVVVDNLKTGLTAVESKQGELCATVGGCVAEGGISEQAIKDLEPALITCESRATNMAAALSDICENEEVNADDRKVLKSIARSVDNKVTSLEEAVAMVTERDDIPEKVREDLITALNTNADRAVDVWDTIDSNEDKLAPHQEVFDGLDRENPQAVTSKIRELLAGNEAELDTRRLLHGALVKADNKAANLRNVARQESHNHKVPADARKQLRVAVIANDSCADQIVAEVRKVLKNKNVHPATRHALHSAIAETDSGYFTLADAARSQAMSPTMPSDIQEILNGSVAEATGKTKELYHAARLAAHDPTVPADVRKVLREALNEDEVTVTESAIDALRAEGVPEYQRRALNDALQETDGANVDLREAVKDVLDTCELSDSMVDILQEALFPVEETNQSLLNAVGTAENDEDLADESRDKAKLRNEQNVSEIVRLLLQDAGIRPTTRSEIATALAAHENFNAQLEDVVRNAIEKGKLPDEAVEKLNAVLERKQLQRKSLEAIVNEAARDPNMPLEARRALADKKTNNIEKNVRIAEDVLTTDLPEYQKDNIERAKKACEGRLKELLDAVKEVAETHDMDDEVKQALIDCEDVVDVHDVVDANVLPEEAESEVRDALARYYGREADLARVLDEVSKDAAVSPDSKSKLQQDSFEGEAIPSVQKALENNDLSDDVRMALEEALNEAQQEGPSAVQQGKDHQMNRLTVELEETLQGLRDELRKEKNGNDRMSDENETLKLTVNEYEQLIDNLGGFEEASKIAASSNSIALDSTIAEKEERLKELNAALRSAQDFDASRNSFDGREEEEEMDEATRIKNQRLRDAFQDGEKASLVTPLPEQYRKQDALDDEDAAFREELTTQWLKGRQGAIGSVVPAEYAAVNGLSDEDALHRADMRRAFLDGLQASDNVVPDTESQEYVEAFKKGREQRDKELHQAGADDGMDDQFTKAFNSGVHGKGSEEVDAGLLADEVPVEECQSLCRVFNRGKWLRNDVLGGDGIDSLDSTRNDDRLDLLASDKSRLAQLLNEIDEWHGAADVKTMRGLGYPAPSPAYFRALQAALDEANNKLKDTEVVVRDQQDKLKAKERVLADEHKTNMSQLAKERAYEVDKLKGLLSQLEEDLLNKGNVHNSLHNRIERLTDQLGKSSAENEILTQELIKKAAIGDVTELVTYYKERERKWNELSQLNRELQVENRTLLTESTALAHKLRALSFVFESRPTLVRSLYELYKLLAHIPQTLSSFAKEAKKRQLPRLEILDEIREVNSEVDTCKDGTRWIIANLFTSYELQHLGTSPQFFIPDGRRLTWRDIQVPSKQRELLLSTWYGDEETSRNASPQRNASPTTRHHDVTHKRR